MICTTQKTNREMKKKRPEIRTRIRTLGVCNTKRGIEMGHGGKVTKLK